jgi:DNA-binding transcriptional MerR regulator
VTVEAWTRDELFDGLDVRPAFVVELERLGLLPVVGRDSAGAPLYGPEAREELDKVIALVELGYQPRDIAAIARKAGLPARQRRALFRRPPVHLQLEDLATRADVDVARLEGWLETGLLAPDMVSEGGRGLFALAAVRRVRLLDDLAAMGVAEQVLGGWARLLRFLETGAQPDAAAVAEGEGVLRDINEHLGRVRGALREWDKLSASYRKRLARLRRQTNGRGRTGRRKRARTRTRGRKGPVADPEV